MSTMTTIGSCAATTCAYNHGGCSALAVTIAGQSGKPACGTFLTIDVRGGRGQSEGHVGACQRLECVHNAELLCTADSISIAADSADCLSYEAR